MRFDNIWFYPSVLTGWIYKSRCPCVCLLVCHRDPLIESSCGRTPQLSATLLIHTAYFWLSVYEKAWACCAHDCAHDSAHDSAVQNTAIQINEVPQYNTITNRFCFWAFEEQFSHNILCINTFGNRVLNFKKSLGMRTIKYSSSIYY